MTSNSHLKSQQEATSHDRQEAELNHRVYAEQAVLLSAPNSHPGSSSTNTSKQSREAVRIGILHDLIEEGGYSAIAPESSAWLSHEIQSMASGWESFDEGVDCLGVFDADSLASSFGLEPVDTGAPGVDEDGAFAEDLHRRIGMHTLSLYNEFLLLTQCRHAFTGRR